MDNRKTKTLQCGISTEKQENSPSGLKVIGYVNLPKTCIKRGKTNEAPSAKQVNVIKQNNSNTITPMGCIKRIGDKIGLISDYELKENVQFGMNDLIGNFTDFKEGDEVIYYYNDVSEWGTICVTGIMRTLSVDDFLVAIEALEKTDKLKADGLLELTYIRFPANSQIQSFYMSRCGNQTIPKPDIVSLPDPTLSLPWKMDKINCERVENRLKTLLRDNRKEECLKSVYDILQICTPQARYLRRFLNLTVCLELELKHDKEAGEAIAHLIALGESRGDSKKALSKLYVELGFCLANQGLFEEAEKAAKYASKLDFSSKDVLLLKKYILRLIRNNNRTSGKL